MNIYEKLLEVQNKLKAPKGQYNDFGKYKYRNCEDILEAVKPLLHDVKALVYLSDAIELIGDRYYVTAKATFVDCEKPENTIVVFASAREEESKKGMDGSQVTGASSSYARKYALNGLFDIDDTKDSDTTNTGDETPQTKAQPKKRTQPKKSQGLSEDSANLINQKLLQYKQITGASVSSTVDAIEKELGFSVKSITNESQASRVVDFLNMLIEQYEMGEVM